MKNEQVSTFVMEHKTQTCFVGRKPGGNKELGVVIGSVDPEILRDRIVDPSDVTADIFIGFDSSYAAARFMTTLEEVHRQLCHERAEQELTAFKQKEAPHA